MSNKWIITAHIFMASWFDVYIWGITFRWRSLSLRVVSPLQIKDTPGISWVTLMKPLPLAGKDGKCLGHLFPSISFHPHQKKALYNNNVIYIYISLYVPMIAPLCPHQKYPYKSWISPCFLHSHPPYFSHFSASVTWRWHVQGGS